MGLSASLFLVAIGAILIWAVNLSVSGVDVSAVGAILLIMGLVGLLLSLLFWGRRDRVVERDHYYDDRP